MKILFVGGTGIISSGCAKRLAADPSVKLSFFSRGKSDRAVPEGVEMISGDVRDPASVRALYDAVKRVTDLLKTEFVGVLDLSRPMGAEGDND